MRPGRYRRAKPDSVGPGGAPAGTEPAAGVFKDPERVFKAAGSDPDAGAGVPVSGAPAPGWVSEGRLETYAYAYGRGS